MAFQTLPNSKEVTVIEVIQNWITCAFIYDVSNGFKDSRTT
jgi:hypothetical protein